MNGHPDVPAEGEDELPRKWRYPPPLLLRMLLLAASAGPPFRLPVFRRFSDLPRIRIMA